MRPLPRAQRVAVALWLIVGLVVWNGIYDLLVGQGIKEYLFREALHQAGRGPQVSIASVLDPFVFYATWASTVWAGTITLAGLLTIELLSRERENLRTREP